MFKKRESEAENSIGNTNEAAHNTNVKNGGKDRDTLIKQWLRDAEQLKCLVPEFDLNEWVGNEAFSAALSEGKTVFEAYAEISSVPKKVQREEIAQNARSARRGTGSASHNPAKLSDKDFKAYIEKIRNGT